MHRIDILCIFSHFSHLWITLTALVTIVTRHIANHQSKISDTISFQKNLVYWKIKSQFYVICSVPKNEYWLVHIIMKHLHSILVFTVFPQKSKLQKYSSYKFSLIMNLTYLVCQYSKILQKKPARNVVQPKLDIF